MLLSLVMALFTDVNVLFIVIGAALIGLISSLVRAKGEKS